MNYERDNDPRWKAARFAAMKRDCFTCQFPGCGKKGVPLNVHHIKKWSSEESLRYVLSNLLTLCLEHHKDTFGKEEQFEKEFQDIVRAKKKEVANAHGRKVNQGLRKWRPRNFKLRI